MAPRKNPMLDPDLVGLDQGDTGLSAEEAALHVIQPPSGPQRADLR